MLSYPASLRACAVCTLKLIPVIPWSGGFRQVTLRWWQISLAPRSEYLCGSEARIDLPINKSAANKSSAHPPGGFRGLDVPASSQGAKRGPSSGEGAHSLTIKPAASERLYQAGCKETPLPCGTGFL